MISNKVIDFIYNTHGRRIIESSHDFLIPARYKTYVDALYARDEALENCFVFVDGILIHQFLSLESRDKYACGTVWTNRKDFLTDLKYM